MTLEQREQAQLVRDVIDIAEQSLVRMKLVLKRLESPVLFPLPRQCETNGGGYVREASTYNPE